MTPRPQEPRTFAADEPDRIDPLETAVDILKCWERAQANCGSPLSPSCAEADLVFEALAETTRLFLSGVDG